MGEETGTVFYRIDPTKCCIAFEVSIGAACRKVEVVQRGSSIFRIREKSLVRSTALALGSLWVGFRISGFPEMRATLWLIAPLLVA